MVRPLLTFFLRSELNIQCRFATGLMLLLLMIRESVSNENIKMSLITRWRIKTSKNTKEQGIGLQHGRHVFAPSLPKKIQFCPSSLCQLKPMFISALNTAKYFNIFRFTHKLSMIYGQKCYRFLNIHENSPIHREVNRMNKIFKKPSIAEVRWMI